MSEVNKLVLAVTTMNGKAQSAVDYFSQFAQDDCHVYISHQITDEGSKPLDIQHPYVTYLPMYGSGLSKNRNNILDHVDQGIYIVCDDDIQMEEHFIQHIRAAYTDSSAQCISFQSKGTLGLRKTYKNTPYIHSSRSILGVSSIELTFDIGAIQEANLSFDEGFGLGAIYPSGEENIFLKDCLDAGIVCSYYPAVLNKHAEESSGFAHPIGRSVKYHIFLRMYGRVRGTCVFLLFRLYKCF